MCIGTDISGDGFDPLACGYLHTMSAAEKSFAAEPVQISRLAGGLKLCL